MRIRDLKTLAAANAFLRSSYIAEFNTQFARTARQSGTAFTACQRKDLDLVFALQYERIVARDNTVSYGKRVLQIEKIKWRFSLASCKVKLYEHLDGTLSVGYGPHIVGRYDRSGAPLLNTSRPQRHARKSMSKSKLPAKKNKRAVEMTHPRKATNASLSSVAWKSHAKKPRDFPKFPQLRLLDRYLNGKTKPDISLATKSGHFHFATNTKNQQRVQMN